MANSDESMRDREETEFMVPDEFPRERISGAVPGAQPKYLATLYKGRYYVSGCTPPELYDRWRVCEDLAAQLAVKSLASKAGKRSHMTENAILYQYYERLVETSWTSRDEACWIMRRVAQQIGWLQTDGPWVTEK